MLPALRMHGPMPQVTLKRLKRRSLKIPGIDGAILFKRKFPEAGRGGFARDRARCVDFLVLAAGNLRTKN
jgi:hypothetical protein